MDLLRKITRLFAMLLVLLMGAALVFPPGLHLEFCFGEDGHFDISPAFCPDGHLAQRQTSGSISFEQIHHDKCQHRAVPCDSSEEIVASNGKNSLQKNKLLKESPRAGYIYSGLFSTPQPTFRPHWSAQLTQQTFPSSHLASLRTVVLLI